MADVADYTAAQDAEYGTWLANHNIYFNGALAFVKDSRVPASTVEAQGYEADGAVRRFGEAPPDMAAPAAVAPPVGDPIVIEAAHAEPTSLDLDTATPPSTDKD